MAELPMTDRTRVRRLPARGSYDRETIDSILDEGLIAHVGIAVEGQPFVIPMVYAPDGDRILLHGSPASRMLRALAAGCEATLTVTLVDGLVIARSGMHHSMNYRSVAAFGRCSEVSEREEKLAALDRVVEHVVPGRTQDARGPSADELRKTLVVAMPLTEASAKIRTGQTVDDEEDLALPIWAGVLPLRTVVGPPEDAPDLTGPYPVPDYVKGYKRP